MSYVAGVLVNPYDAVLATRRAQWAFSQAGISSFLNREIVPNLQKRATWRFDKEGDMAVGGRWAPLRSSTESYRAAGGFGPAHPINVRTGTLRDWVINNQGRTSNSRGGVRLEWPGSTSVGGPELTRKLRTAQRGRRKPYTVARPVVGWSDSTDWIMARTALRKWTIEQGGLKPGSWVGK